MTKKKEAPKALKDREKVKILALLPNDDTYLFRRRFNGNSTT